ncbi:MAG: esterase/lipase superfamily enzyme, partial [Halieaceae bacterium]
MLFITNRFPTQSIRTRINRNWNFDLDNNAASNSIYFCERQSTGNYQEIGSISFFSRLKDSDCRQLLIYLHGFSNLPEDVFRTTSELQRFCDRKGRGEVLVVPMVWPCDNDLGIVQDYWDDQKAADLSAYSFARVLNKFIAWRNEEKYNPKGAPCLKRINVLAHSMGNRVLRKTLQEWNRYDLANGIPLLFRNTFMLAADVVNECL